MNDRGDACSSDCQHRRLRQCICGFMCRRYARWNSTKEHRTPLRQGSHTHWTPVRMLRALQAASAKRVRNWDQFYGAGSWKIVSQPKSTVGGVGVLARYFSSQNRENGTQRCLRKILILMSRSNRTNEKGSARVVNLHPRERPARLILKRDRPVRHNSQDVACRARLPFHFTSSQPEKLRLQRGSQGCDYRAIIVLTICNAHVWNLSKR